MSSKKIVIFSFTAKVYFLSFIYILGALFNAERHYENFLCSHSCDKNASSFGIFENISNDVWSDDSWECSRWSITLMLNNFIIHLFSIKDVIFYKSKKQTNYLMIFFKIWDRFFNWNIKSQFSHVIKLPLIVTFLPCTW